MVTGALLAAGVALGWLWLGGAVPWPHSSERAAPQEPVAEVAAVPRPPLPPAAVPAPLAAAGASTAGAPDAGRPRPEQVEPAWSATPVAARALDLGGIGPLVNYGLVEARDEMGHCFPAEPSPNPATPPVVKDEHGNTVAPAVLALYLVAREGAIDVVDVAVDAYGDERPEVVRCCADVLRGHEIRVSATAVTPGQRYRLRYELY